MDTVIKKLLIALLVIVAVSGQSQDLPQYTLQELLEAVAKQGAGAGTTNMTNLLVMLLQQFIRVFLRPLLSNVGVGMTNALTASLMGRELTLIPDAVAPIPLHG